MSHTRYALAELEAIAHDLQTLGRRLGRVTGLLEDMLEADCPPPQEKHPGGPLHDVETRQDTISDQYTGWPDIEAMAKTAHLAHPEWFDMVAGRAPELEPESLPPPAEEADETGVPEVDESGPDPEPTAESLPPPRRRGRTGVVDFEPVPPEERERRRRVVLEALLDGPRRGQELDQLCPSVTPPQRLVALSGLLSEGLVDRTGATSGTRWHLTPRGLSRAAPPQAESPPPPPQGDPSRELAEAPGRSEGPIPGRSADPPGLRGEGRLAPVGGVFHCLRQDRSVTADACQEDWATAQGAPRRHVGSPCLGCEQGARRRLQAAGAVPTEQLVDDLLLCAEVEASGRSHKSSQTASAARRRLDLAMMREDA